MLVIVSRIICNVFWRYTSLFAFRFRLAILCPECINTTGNYRSEWLPFFHGGGGRGSSRKLLSISKSHLVVYMQSKDDSLQGCKKRHHSKQSFKAAPREDPDNSSNWKNNVKRRRRKKTPAIALIHIPHTYRTSLLSSPLQSPPSQKFGLLLATLQQKHCLRFGFLPLTRVKVKVIQTGIKLKSSAVSSTISS